MIGLHIEKLQQAGDLEDPHGPSLGVSKGESPLLFTQAMLRIDQSRDTRTVDKGKSGEIKHDLGWTLRNNAAQYLRQLGRGGHIQFAGQKDHGILVKLDDLGRKHLSRAVHAWPNPKVLPDNITQSLPVIRPRRMPRLSKAR